jgi:Zn-dependent M16 (insulinase) family peptidase
VLVFTVDMISWEISVDHEPQFEHISCTPSLHVLPTKNTSSTLIIVVNPHFSFVISSILTIHMHTLKVLKEIGSKLKDISCTCSAGHFTGTAEFILRWYFYITHIYMSSRYSVTFSLMTKMLICVTWVGSLVVYEASPFWCPKVLSMENGTFLLHLTWCIV